mmetsp:Transcript_79532/g.137967  ORF Transcript_79532/g.137967 Transcript_79532/m.137967 type:complete len:255 (+) Transcript_79532:242-1006(+)
MMPLPGESPLLGLLETLMHHMQQVGRKCDDSSACLGIALWRSFAAPRQRSGRAKAGWVARAPRGKTGALRRRTRSKLRGTSLVPPHLSHAGERCRSRNPAVLGACDQVLQNLRALPDLVCPSTPLRSQRAASNQAILSLLPPKLAYPGAHAQSHTSMHNQAATAARLLFRALPLQDDAAATAARPLLRALPVQDYAAATAAQLLLRPLLLEDDAAVHVNQNRTKVPTTLLAGQPALLSCHACVVLPTLGGTCSN